MSDYGISYMRPGADIKRIIHAKIHIAWHISPSGPIISLRGESPEG
jgi:hypothetical protein